MVAAMSAGVDASGRHRLGVMALVHDIGMARLPAGLGNKSTLTADERALVETHTAEGARLLLDDGGPGFELAAVVAYEHHLRPDGTGYPARRFRAAAHWASRLIGSCFDLRIVAAGSALSPGLVGRARCPPPRRRRRHGVRCRGGQAGRQRGSRDLNVSAHSHRARGAALFHRRGRDQGGRLQRLADRVVPLRRRGDHAAPAGAGGAPRIWLEAGDGRRGVRGNAGALRARQPADDQRQYHLSAVDGTAVCPAARAAAPARSRSVAAICRSSSRCWAGSPSCCWAANSPSTTAPDPGARQHLRRVERLELRAAARAASAGSVARRGTATAASPPCCSAT